MSFLGKGNAFYIGNSGSEILMYEQLTLFGTPLPSEEISEIMLYDVIDFWYKNFAAVMKPGTAESYCSSIKRIKRYIPNRPFYQLLEVDVQNGLNNMVQSGYSKSSVKKAVTVFKQAFRCARRNNLIDRYPQLDLIVPPNASEKKVRALSLSEQQKVEYCCEYLKYGYLTLFLFQTGLRTSELCNLNWADYVAGSSAHIVIRQSKTAAGVRIVPLTASAECIIQMQPLSNGNIFLSERGNKISAAIFKEHNRELRRLSGVDDFHNHVCRHTFATRALERGMNVKALSAMLGHTSVAFTMQRYADAMNSWLFEQIHFLEDI